MNIRQNVFAPVLLVTATLVAPALVSQPANAATCVRTASVVVIPLTAAKHRAVIAHANLAIKKYHYPRIMVLNRVGATARRNAAVRGIPTKAGWDRDEYPAAVGRRVNRAHVSYVPSSQNRSAGAVMGNKLRPYCNGTRFIYAGT